MPYSRCDSGEPATICGYCHADTGHGSAHAEGCVGAIEWPAGDFYDCRDSGQLSCRDPEEAVFEALEIWMDPGCDALGVIREHGALTVTAYGHDEVPEDWYAKEALRLVGHAEDSFDEEFFSSADRGAEIGNEARQKARGRIVIALRTLFAGIEPYNCHETGHIDLTPEQTEALMRVYEPSWFEEEDKHDR